MWYFIDREECQRFKPQDADDPRRQAQQEIIGMKRCEVEQIAQRGDRQHKTEDGQRPAGDPPERRVRLV